MRPKEVEADIYVARSSGVIKIKGKRFDYSRGLTVVRAGDPLLLALPDKFIPLPGHVTVPERT